ncbi:hypothetical protein [Nocardia sp. NPDC052566]|uniref:hypothetical protein n=1 Tax=Nocardia sp. NPDC052566 TaxID=3364330 RepID=UPI0037CA16EF
MSADCRMLTPLNVPARRSRRRRPSAARRPTTRRVPWWLDPRGRARTPGKRLPIVRSAVTRRVRKTSATGSRNRVAASTYRPWEAR